VCIDIDIKYEFQYESFQMKKSLADRISAMFGQHEWKIKLHFMMRKILNSTIYLG